MTGERPWTFLTNHGHMLVAVAREPEARVQDLAAVVGVTPRSALSLLADLEEAGYLHRTRTGRRTTYTLHPHQPFRHPTTASHEVDELLAIFTGGAVPQGGAS
jgi:DeoR/GlpR family transcriptional regulator of sugar metabolism